MTDESRLAVATRAAREGGAVAEAGFRSDLDVEYKDGKNDVVTSSDRAAQRRVISVIEAQFPDDPVVAEEEDAPTAVPDDGPAWIVDPIDGTNNYVRGNRIWSTAVAAVRDGDPVAAAVDHPSIGDIYRAGAASDDGRGDQPGAGAGGERARPVKRETERERPATASPSLSRR